MTAQKIEDSDVVADQGESVNEVRLVGRVAGEPEERQLANGETVVNVRLAVARSGKPAERQRTDSIELAAWSSQMKAKLRKMRPGDLVEVHGAIRRRFFRAGAATASRVEVEVERSRSLRSTRRGASG